MLLSLLRAHALLHRGTRVRDHRGRIVANVADYSATYHLVEKLFSEVTEAAVPKVVRETVETVRAYLDEKGAAAITLTQLAKELGLDKGAAHHRVRKAITAGYLVNDEAAKGKPARIVLGDPLPEPKSLLPEPGVLECWEEGDEHNSQGVSFPETASTLQQSLKKPDSSRDLTVEEGFSTVLRHFNASLQHSNAPLKEPLNCCKGVELATSTVNPLFPQEKPPTIEVLKSKSGNIPTRNCGDSHPLVRRRGVLMLRGTAPVCKRCGNPATPGEPVVPCGREGSAGPYHLRCWSERRTNTPALGPEGDSLDDFVSN
jgi:hypothetical protein